MIIIKGYDTKTELFLQYVNRTQVEEIFNNQQEMSNFQVEEPPRPFGHPT